MATKRWAFLDGLKFGGVEAVQILVARVTIANADIKKLPGTPYQIVTTPGSGSFLRPIACTTSSHFSSGAYSTLDTGYAALVFSPTNATGHWLTTPLLNDNSQTPNLTQLTAFFGATNYVMDWQIPFLTSFTSGASFGHAEWVIQNNENLGGAAVDTQRDDKAIYLSLDNNGNTADLTGGHASNVLKVKLYYIIEAL